MHNLDDYAWYEVGIKRFYNKLQAVMECKKKLANHFIGMRTTRYSTNTNGIKNQHGPWMSCMPSARKEFGKGMLFGFAF